MTSNHQLINQTSGDTEYYTPIAVIEAARRVMGAIDLDPASSERANLRVGARRYFTMEQDGLGREWRGRVFMNHPFSRVGNPLWINHLIAEFERGGVREFCCLTYACTSELWFRPLHNFVQCYLVPRTNYELPDGTLKRGVTKGSVVTYGGRNSLGFVREFSALGHIKVPLGYPTPSFR